MSLQKNGTVTPSPRSALGTRFLHASSVGPNSTSPSDESLWRRLKEAGFDEDMIRRRDKAALIAYITRLEAELYDYQHHMGLLITEKKEWMSKYEQIKATADLAEISYKRDEAAHVSALSEAKRHGESLEKALDIERECTANIEKALHELRAECAETKIAAERKLAEAQKLMAEAQQKSDEADNRIRASESLHAEAKRCERNVARKLQDVEAREDDIRRRLLLSKTEWDAKEKDLSLERQSIHDTHKLLQHEQAKLVERQSYLNSREEHIFTRSQELDKLEKEFEVARANMDKELFSIKQGKLNLESDVSALATREKVIAEKEVQLEKREMDLLNMQLTIASKEQDIIQRLKSEHESFVAKRNSEFEAELALRLKLAEDELDVKKQSIELRQVDTDLRAKAVQERENAMEVKLKALLEKEADFTRKLQTVSEKEECVSHAQKTAEKEKLELQKERDEMNQMRLDMEEAKKLVEEEKNRVTLKYQKIHETISEKNELLILEKKLKEEIDSFRAKKMEFVSETDLLRAEKEKFEQEWELIDEKKDQLSKEAERIAKENDSVCQYIKNEWERLKLEKDILQNQFKSDFELLSREREETTINLEREHSDWLGKIQHERDILVEELKLHKRELETLIEKRQEEMEAHLREREETFEKEKAQELQKICSQTDMIAKELDHIEMEKEKLNNERMEIIESRAARDREWLEIKNFIDELNIQRNKLQEQRELLIIEKVEVQAKIQQLKELQDLNIASENWALSESNRSKAAMKSNVADCLSRQPTTNTDLNEQNIKIFHGSTRDLPSKIPSDASPPPSASFSWIRKCVDVIFKRSPERTIGPNNDKIVECMVPSQREYLNSNASDIECIAKNGSISTRNEFLTEKLDLTKPSIAEFPSASINAGKEHVEEKTACTEKGCTDQSNSFLPEELDGTSRFVVHKINDSSLGKKRSHGTFTAIGSNSQFESSEDCMKRQRHENVSEGSLMEHNSEIVNSSKICLEGMNDLTPLEQTSGYAKSTKFHEEVEHGKDIGSTEHAKVSQIVEPLQSDNLTYEEGNV